MYIGEYWWHPWANTLLYWPLVTDANDASGNSRDGTPTSSVTFSSSDWAYIPSGNRINIPQFTVPTVVTISMWVKFITVGNTWRLYSDWSGSIRNMLVHHYNLSKLSWLFWDWSTNQQELQRNDTLTYNVWNNYVLVKNWTSVTVYHNNQDKGTQTTLYNVAWWNNTWQEFSIWNISWETAQYYFKDYIIEDKAWTQQEVSDYYNLTKWNYWIS